MMYTYVAALQIALYADDDPQCILLQSDDVMGLFIADAPGAVSYATSATQTVRFYFGNETQYPVVGARVQFDTLAFPNSFNIQVQVELGTTFKLSIKAYVTFTHRRLSSCSACDACLAETLMV